MTDDLRECVKTLERVLDCELSLLLKYIPNDSARSICVHLAIGQIKDVIRTLESSIAKLEAAGSSSSPI